MRDSAGGQALIQVAPDEDANAMPRASLQPNEMDAVAKRLGGDCSGASVIAADDAYEAASGGPMFRIACGDIWFDIDGATGALVNRLDPSRRAWRWLFGGLHTLDFSWLSQRGWLRSSLIVVMCGYGFVFSLTGVVIGWRRIRSTVGRG